MRFLFTTYEYPEFMRWLYARYPKLAHRSYFEQLEVRLAQGFLWADFYSRNLRLLGHEATEVVPENPFMQFAWAREHGVRTKRWRLGLRRGRLPWPEWREDRSWVERILAEQIRAYRPDVLFVRDIGFLRPQFLREVREQVRLIVGQHASRLDMQRDYSGYDLMLSSLPNFVARFREKGIRSEVLRLGFEPRVVERLASRPKTIEASFVGKLGGDHASRITFIEGLVAQSDVELWGTSADELSEAARSRFRGSAWGIDMYQVLRDSNVTINQHEQWAEDHANNLRLFEATGVGTCLITDAKSDLATLFEPGREVVAYRSVEECREIVQHLLCKPQEREALAVAGQRRTLAEHTYAHRMQELLDILRKYL